MHYPHIPNISVGNRIIDSEYKKMFEIIHRIQHSIMAKDCAAIAADFKLLEDFARACFSVEEKIARSVGFDFTLYNLAHQNLLKKYQQVGDELAARNGSWSSGEGEAYKHFINDCLMKHLGHESRPLRIVLNTYLYDFKPRIASASYRVSKLERDMCTQLVPMFELRGRSVDQGKVFCRCVEGHCFLEKDAEWAKQNRAQALHPNGAYLDRTLLNTLEAERLHEKSEWMDSLGVNGTCQICCRNKTENSSETRKGTSDLI